MEKEEQERLTSQAADYLHRVLPRELGFLLLTTSIDAPERFAPGPMRVSVIENVAAADRTAAAVDALQTAIKRLQGRN